jgi:hypothetical protein
MAHLTLSLGGLVDPDNVGSGRPEAVEGGLDVELDVVDKWALTGAVGAVYYVSNDPHQLAATAGVQWSPNDNLDLSVVVLVGFLDGSDTAALLFGLSPKVSLW